VGGLVPATHLNAIILVLHKVGSSSLLGMSSTPFADLASSKRRSPGSPTSSWTATRSQHQDLPLTTRSRVIHSPVTWGWIPVKWHLRHDAPRCYAVYILPARPSRRPRL